MTSLARALLPAPPSSRKGEDDDQQDALDGRSVVHGHQQQLAADHGADFAR